MSTSRHREAAGRSRATRRGHLYRLQGSGASPLRIRNLPRSDAVQIFRARAKHTLLLADRERHNWSVAIAYCLCGEQEETVQHVLSECPSRWPDKPVYEVLWCGDQVVMSTAVNYAGVPPKSHAVKAETRLRRFMSEKKRLASTSPRSTATSKLRGCFLLKYMGIS
ncbi:hypothetical protein PoB_001730300 [Plakobranchus ocellatus]|uniref:Reverse transcriptase zinc-binding domain-containing protein n=1 Tax=Plakobranchus ocellatus TaxID=259542 RepID=A0AAV3Z7T9_9GAST|nr:hypothetical protein PoB_001730300 [Plakobranchus ocellatus]